MVPATQNRLLELLDSVRSEFEQLTQDAIICKTQRDEFEMKMNSQIQEMGQIQQSLLDLERSQQVMKKHYEEEINRLRQQLEQVTMKKDNHGQHVPPPSYINGYSQPPPQQQQTPSPAPPALDANPSSAQHPVYTNGLPPAGSPSGPHTAPPPPLSGSPYANGSPQTSVAPQRPSPLNVKSETTSFAEMDPESIPANWKVEGQDWFALFNPKVPRYLKVDLLHSFDHSSVVCCVKFSANGRYLAAGCNQSTYIYDTTSGSRVAVLQDEHASRDTDLYIRSVSFSPDGKYLATGAEDKQIRIWDISKNRIRHVLRGHEQDIYSLEFSREGNFLVSGSGDRTVKIWDWLEGRILHTLRINDQDQKDPGVTSVAISPDGRLVAAGSLDKVVRVWDAHNGQPLERLEGHKDSVYSVAFMPDGMTLISGSLDKTLRLWQLGAKGNSTRQVFNGHKDFVLSVATTPDGQWIVSGSKDRGVQFWDPHTGQTQFMLQGHKNSVISVATSPASRRPMFATGSGDNRARIWTFEPLQQPLHS
ncbi:WD40 repeat-like protein [Hesseltinella vesiculosa]|uniref:WD40 repeat-like protein n=1 Tax=Hesseltinella vesiculosa TaxID=101127 RepID=A0A1X2G5X7_9FUNG|nr:WD40 repeat-like protein [Hesseltinella vesiculosa]